MKKIAILGTAVRDQVFIGRDIINYSTCNKIDIEESFGGSMHNVSYHCGVLNLETHFISKWGNDLFATDMIQALETKKVFVYGNMLPFPTPVFTALYDHKKWMYLSSITDDFYYSGNDECPFVAIEHCDYGITDNDDEVFLSRLLQRTPHTKWILSARLPSEKLWSKIEGVILNREEATHYAKGESWESLVTALLAKMKWVIITLDAEGALFYDHTHKKMFLIKERKEGTPLGCGDAFTAGLVYGLSQSMEPIQAMDKAMQAAALIYEVPGVLSDRLIEITQEMSE